jgi:hypothetical protein
MISHPDRPIKGMQTGWMTERVSTTDWFEGLGELMYGSTWAETALMLTTLEIPAVYVIKDINFVFAIDALEASLENGNLTIKNISQSTATISVFSENSKDLKKPFGELRLMDSPKITLKTNEKTTISI